MQPRLRAPALLACAIAIALPRIAAATPLLTIRVASIDAALHDIETVAKSAHSTLTRRQMLEQLAAMLGVEDVSFLDLSRPAAFAMPQEGLLLGQNGFVLAVPVRDGARALDVLAKQFSERSVDGELTVFRGMMAGAEETAQKSMYAALHGKVLVLGGSAELVRQFDPASALSGEGLPPGSLTFSAEIEPVAALLTGWLSAMQQKLRETPPVPVPSSALSGGDADEEESPDELQKVAPAAAGPAGDGPLQVGGEVSAPERVSNMPPEYPEAARLARVQGKVILQAVIDEEGVVQGVEVLRSIPELDQAAIDAVKQWRYKPALRHGHPVKVYFTVVVNFHLAGGDPRDADASGPRKRPPASSFELQKLAKFLDLYYGFLRDSVNALSKLQVSLEVSEGYLVVHARGVARPGTPLAGFIAAQRDVGLPAIGRMMPADASMLVAGQLEWTDASRAWIKEMLQKYQAAMADLLKQTPRGNRESAQAALQAMRLWSADRIVDCHRGDLAFAMDNEPQDLRMLQVWGLSDTEDCRGALSSAMSTVSASGTFLEKEVLEPEKITTYVFKFKVPDGPAAAGKTDAKETTVRLAEVAHLLISGTDPWASKAIRAAASAREGSTPGGGGLLLTDLGPFTERPGLFGRMQIGTVLGQAAGSAKGEGGMPGLPDELLRALDGPAGALPFAMRFDDGAVTSEIAIPLAMFEAFATHAPAAAPSEKHKAP